MEIALTLSLANCGPLNAVLGRFSSLVLFSLVTFFGRLARGPESCSPINFNTFCNKQTLSNCSNSSKRHLYLSSLVRFQCCFSFLVHHGFEYSYFQAINSSYKKLLTCNFHCLMNVDWLICFRSERSTELILNNTFNFLVPWKCLAIQFY